MKHYRKQCSFIIWGTIICFIIAWIQHSAYEFLGKPQFLAFLLPVNESIWEHLKLAFYPVLIVVLCPWNNYIKSIPLKKRIVMSAISVILSQSIILFGYYGLKEGFLLEGLWVDLVLLIIGIIWGLFHGIMTENEKIGNFFYYLSIVYLIAMILLFWRFSFYPPSYPVFQAP